MNAISRSSLSAADTERLIGALLRGAAADWSHGDDAGAIAEFLDAGRYHGVLPLLDAELARGTASAAWPTAILLECHKATVREVVYESARHVEIVRVLEALGSEGVRPVLLKGTALAYTHYAKTSLRPRADTDLLIPLDRRIETERTLARIGYTKSVGVEGELISHQSTWSRTDARGAPHHLDVHWRINNSPMLANVLTYDELATRALPLPALGPNARTPAPVHSLIFACIHRAGHVNAPYDVSRVARFGRDRLIWLYDVHLLIGGMSPGELDEFAALASERKMRAICCECLQRTRERFATPIPAHVIDRLTGRGPVEASARYLSGGGARQMVGEFLAFDRWSDRGGWVREVALPSVDYMRTKYPDAAITWLPILYARRAFTGLAHLVFSRSGGR